MAVNETLQRFIIKLMVKKIVYDPVNNKFHILQKSLNDEEWQRILQESARHGVSEEVIRAFINRLNEDIVLTPKRETVRKIAPVDIPLGQHLLLNTLSEVHGPVKIELLCTGKGRFIVLDCDNKALKFRDELISLSQPWNVSFTADFNVFRDGKLYPDTTKIFRTYKIDSIELLHPPDVYEILDAEDDAK